MFVPEDTETKIQCVWNIDAVVAAQNTIEVGPLGVWRGGNELLSVRVRSSSKTDVGVDRIGVNSSNSLED